MKTRRGDSNSGTAIIEFAFLIIPLFLLVFGIIDYGWLFFTDIQVTNAAREGARAASVGDDGEGRAQEYLSQTGHGGAASVAVETAGDQVSVTVTYTFTPLVGFVPVPDSLEAVSVMRLEAGGG